MTPEQKSTFVDALRNKLNAHSAYILHAFDSSIEGLVYEWFNEKHFEQADANFTNVYFNRRLARVMADAAIEAGFAPTLNNLKAAFDNNFQNFRDLIADYMPKTDCTSSQDCITMTRPRI